LQALFWGQQYTMHMGAQHAATAPVQLICCFPDSEYHHRGDCANSVPAEVCWMPVLKSWLTALKYWQRLQQGSAQPCIYITCNEPDLQDTQRLVDGIQDMKGDSSEQERWHIVMSGTKTVLAVLHTANVLLSPHVTCGKSFPDNCNAQLA
jgi:hypothetical protein